MLDTVKENFKDMRSRLKEKPYDLDNQDDKGKTVLIQVIEMRNFTEQMWVLLDYGANPNIQDLEKKTALHYACANDRKDMIIALLLFGADPEIKDEEDKTPFEYARDDMNQIMEIINDIKKEFILLTRKRRKFLKYIFDETDKDYGAKVLTVANLTQFYMKINKETESEATKDAQSFISGAKLSKSSFEDNSSITFEEFIVAICRIVKIHGMKPVDELINRFKKIRVKFVPKVEDEENNDKKEE